jgi:1,4-alpha-glucan branching enzyme
MTLGDLDLYLIGEGRHERLWEVLGAHVQRGSTGELRGTSFRVWAPNARAVSLVCDYNYWDRSTNPMRSLGNSGIWEIFIEGAGPGEKYKFAIHKANGLWVDHADPLARYNELAPATASIVHESTYIWRDSEWIARRSAQESWRAPVSIYEMHLGSWRPGLTYRELAIQLVKYLTTMGYTHVEFLPVMEHPFGGSWGYQVTGFFAPTARFGSPDDFKYLVDTLHDAGIGVILDWVPAHFPKDEWALANFDGTALYEHADPRLGEHPDWGTLIFNYGRNEVRNFLVASAIYWLREFHIDGIRVDAVASMLYLDYSRKDGEWLPNKFGGRENLEAVALLQEVNSCAYREAPGIMMIAEESTAWGGVTKPTSEGGLGFGYKWNMGWMHDSLEYIQHESVHRVHHHNEITFSILYAWSENFILPLSHDEVVHGKGSLLSRIPGDDWQKFATLRALYGFMWAHPGKKLLFMGSDFAQRGEWRESSSLDWHLLDEPLHQGVALAISRLNSIYRDRPALWQRDTSPESFTWIMNNDGAGNTLAFTRWSDDGTPLVSITNFSAVVHENYQLVLPMAGDWIEIFNSDSIDLGGSAVTNAEIQSRQGEPSILRLPPLATIWLVRR